MITLLLGGALRPSGAGRPPQAAVGYPAPDFTLTDLHGEPLQLASLRGKAVLLNFWATWCPPCQAEMPELKRLQAAHPELVILGVDDGEPVATVQRFMAAGGYDWPVVIDDGSVSDTYEAISLPTSFFVGPDGVIRAAYRGPMSFGLMEELLAGTAGAEAPGGVAWPAWLAGRLVPPVLPLGPLPLQLGPILLVGGFLVADWLLRRRSGAPETAERLLGWLAGGALGGAKLGEVLRSPGSFIEFPRLLIALPAGRWALVGAVVGAGIGLWWALQRVERTERWRRLDELGVPLLVALAITGVGSGEAALLQGVGWLLGAVLLWFGREREGLFAGALSWAAAVYVVADLARPVATIPGGLTVEQLVGAAAVGLTLVIARLPKRVAG